MLWKLLTFLSPNLRKWEAQKYLSTLHLRYSKHQIQPVSKATSYLICSVPRDIALLISLTDVLQWVVTASSPALAAVSEWLIYPLTPHQRSGGTTGRSCSPGRRTRRRQTHCWWRGRWGGSAVARFGRPGRPTKTPQPSSPGTQSDLEGGGIKREE